MERSDDEENRATMAMRHGLEYGLQAVTAYTLALNNDVDVYACGVIISPFRPWIAATPDHKIYNLARDPAFDLLEIKCPMKDSIAEVDYLDLIGGQYSLRKTHSYFYQIMCQLAVAGLH